MRTTGGFRGKVSVASRPAPPQRNVRPFITQRWESFRHLQAQAGTVPVTIRSGKQQVVRFRFACDKSLRYIIDHVAFLSLRWSEWARACYAEQRARGHSYRQALRALSAKWLKIIFVMWERQVPVPPGNDDAAAVAPASEKSRLT